MQIAAHKKDVNCACAICTVMLTRNDELADRYVYKCGELSYIELAHVACARKFDPPGLYWNHI